jgi:hypothetical protein
MRSRGSPLTLPSEGTETDGGVIMVASGLVFASCQSWLRKSDWHDSQNIDVASHGLLHRKHWLIS